MTHALRDLVGLRVVAVHAHPDDEAITTGGTLADLAARGADTTVITCTLGEQGEVIGEPYQNLVADRTDQLGGFRIRELHDSLAVLGVHGEFLGGVACWRDSGMVGDPANEHPRAFIHSGGVAVKQLHERLEALQPHLVITYGPDGGYGHPDHIRAHEITHQAVTRLDYCPRIAWAVTATSVLNEALAAITDLPEGWRRAEHGELSSVEKWDCEHVLSDAALSAKIASFKAHATQLWVADGSVSDVNPRSAVASISNGLPVVFALSNLIAQPMLRSEFFQLGAGAPFAGDVASGLEW